MKQQIMTHKQRKGCLYDDVSIFSGKQSEKSRAHAILDLSFRAICIVPSVPICSELHPRSMGGKHVLCQLQPKQQWQWYKSASVE